MSNMLPRPLPESPPALADVLAVPVAPRGRHVEDGALAAQGGDRHLVGVGVDADVMGVALADHQGVEGAGGAVQEGVAGIDRRSVVAGKRVSVRLVLGGGVVMTKNNI